MTRDWMSPGLQARIQSLAAAGRNEIERHEDKRISRRMARHQAITRGFGAVAIGIFSAGFAILLTVVVLNLMFHFSPSWP